MYFKVERISDTKSGLLQSAAYRSSVYFIGESDLQLVSKRSRVLYAGLSACYGSTMGLWPVLPAADIVDRSRKETDL